jgi:hypothetical protein
MAALESIVRLPLLVAPGKQQFVIFPWVAVFF